MIFIGDYDIQEFYIFYMCTNVETEKYTYSTQPKSRILIITDKPALRTYQIAFSTHQ
jgi:hypothetical protein